MAKVFEQQLKEAAVRKKRLKQEPAIDAKAVRKLRKQLDELAKQIAKES